MNIKAEVFTCSFVVIKRRPAENLPDNKDSLNVFKKLLFVLKNISLVRL